MPRDQGSVSAYEVTALQNGQTRYSVGISLPQLGHALSPAPTGAGGGAAGAPGVGAVAPSGGASDQPGPPFLGGIEPAAASGVVSVPTEIGRAHV